MLRRFYTVMIVPHEGGALRRLSVSLPFIVTMAGLFLFCFVSSAFLSKFFLGTMHPVGSDERLHAENERLELELSRTRGLLQETTLKLDTVIEKQDELDRVAGNAPSDDGMGGEIETDAPGGRLFTADGDWLSTTRSILDKADFRIQRMDERMCEMHAEPEHVEPDGLAWPTRGRVTSGFGRRRDPFDGSSQFHEGVDIATAFKSEVWAVDDGVVLEARRHGGYGNMVLLDHGNGRKTLYGHLYRFNVKPGEAIHKGQVVGLVGSTGRSTGPHLHFEVLENDRPVNPGLK